MGLHKGGALLISDIGCFRFIDERSRNRENQEQLMRL